MIAEQIKFQLIHVWYNNSKSNMMNSSKLQTHTDRDWIKQIRWRQTIFQPWQRCVTVQYTREKDENQLKWTKQTQTLKAQNTCLRVLVVTWS